VRFNSHHWKTVLTELKRGMKREGDFVRWNENDGKAGRRGLFIGNILTFVWEKWWRKVSCTSVCLTCLCAVTLRDSSSEPHNWWMACCLVAEGGRRVMTEKCCSDKYWWRLMGTVIRDIKKSHGQLHKEWNYAQIFSWIEV